MAIGLQLPQIGFGSYATGIRRMFAYVGDCTLLFLGIAASQALLRPVNPVLRNLSSPGVLQAWVFWTVTIPIWLYFAWQERRYGAAPVARRLRLRVVSADGAAMTWRQALLRNAVKLVPFELNHAVILSPVASHAAPSRIGQAVVWGLVLAYVAAMYVNRRRQSVHDMIARTVVVHADA